MALKHIPKWRKMYGATHDPADKTKCDFRALTGAVDQHAPKPSYEWSLGPGFKLARVELSELRSAIRKMSVRSELYRLLKQELSARGWWKNRARGKPGNLQGNAKENA